MRSLLRQAALIVCVIALLFVPPVAPRPHVETATAAPPPVGEAEAMTGVLAEESFADPTPSPSAAPTPTPRPDWGPAPTGPAVVVPILMYHYVRVNPDPRDQLGFGLSVTPANFAQQMDLLASAGYRPITPADLAGALRGTNGLPARAVLLTFDDGYADFYTSAAPVLRAHSFQAVVYVITGKVGQWSYLTWPQIEELDRAGFTIGAHTVNHVPLAQQARAVAQREIQQSKRDLEDRLQHPVLDFAYPYGSFNAGVEGEVQAAGFETAMSTIGGAFHFRATLLHLSRIGVTGRDTSAGFLAKLQLGSRR